MFLKARTGELTPPGISDLALLKRAIDLSILFKIIYSFNGFIIDSNNYNSFMQLTL